MARSNPAAGVARAAMAAVLAQDKGAIPAASPHEPRRVTAHLADFRIEAEFPPQRPDSMLMIDRNGAPMLKAHVTPVWKGKRRHDEIEVIALHGDEWFADFLAEAPARPQPAKRPRRKSPAGKRKKAAARGRGGRGTGKRISRRATARKRPRRAHRT